MRINEFQKQIIAPMRNMPPVPLNAYEQTDFIHELALEFISLARSAYLAGVDLDSVAVTALALCAVAGKPHDKIGLGMATGG